MPKVVEIRKTDDPRDVIHQACQLLAEGALVAFPTETVYVVAAFALNGAAVARLQALVPGEPLVFAVKSGEEALDYVPRMSPLGRKLARRCWPGPVTLEMPADSAEGLLSSLPPETQQAVVRGGELRLRVPAHEAVYEVLRLLPGPLVFSPERSLGTATATGADLSPEAVDAVALVIEDGACRYGEPSTVVRVDDGNPRIVEPGVVTQRTVGRLASEVILFVCTGNTCRSPMAEGLFRRLLAERLKCTDEDLVDRGYVVVSAGLAAQVGSPASPEAVELLAPRGIDLRSHESQPLTDRLLDQVDRIYTMTRHHRDSIIAERPDLAHRVWVLSQDGMDISDPIGAGVSEYQMCHDEIQRHLLAIIDQIEVR